MGLFAKEEYSEAKTAFLKGKSLAADQFKYGFWLRKCDAELVDEIDDETNVVSESKPLPKQNRSNAETAKQTLVPDTPDIQSTLAASAKPSRFRHEWFQTDTFVNVDLFAKGIKPQNLKVSIAEQNLAITIQLDSGSEFLLDLDLADKIVVAESTYQLLSTKIEIKLKKSRVARWKTLETTGEDSVSVLDARPEGSKINPAGLYPSSRGAKNWDAIAKEDEEEKLTGDHATNKLFKANYKDATEEQRRAMMKSYVESNGTVLSTNWEEVGAAEVKGSPPTGMEMKSWNDSRDVRAR
jgi:suppressor of G2 allele of SKP1